MVNNPLNLVDLNGLKVLDFGFGSTTTDNAYGLGNNNSINNNINNNIKKEAISRSIVTMANKQRKTEKSKKRIPIYPRLKEKQLSQNAEKTTDIKLINKLNILNNSTCSGYSDNVDDKYTDAVLNIMGTSYKYKIDNLVKNSTTKYLKTALSQVLQGNYAEESNLLGSSGRIAVGLTDFDLPADFIDLHYDLTHFNNTYNWWSQFGIDSLSFLPIIGVIKYSDDFAEIGKATNKLFKSGDKMISESYVLSKNAKKHIARHIPSKFSKQINHLSDSQLISKLGRKSFFILIGMMKKFMK